VVGLGLLREIVRCASRIQIISEQVRGGLGPAGQRLVRRRGHSRVGPRLFLLFWLLQTYFFVAWGQKLLGVRVGNVGGRLAEVACIPQDLL
jgi:hypothetical protein